MSRSRPCAGAALLLAALSLAACGRRSDAEPASVSARRVNGAIALTSGACGSDGLADCPLQGWMKANGTQSVLHQDYDRLAAMFTHLGAMAPSDYPSWSSFAKDGENAAKAHDLESVRRVCKRCHDTYRAAYRDAYRSRPIP